MNRVDECLSQIRDAETEDLIESYKSFIDEMSEKGVDLENILSFDEYKKFHNFQKQYYSDMLCFGNLQLETIDRWNEEVPQAKISHFDFYGK